MTVGEFLARGRERAAAEAVERFLESLARLGAVYLAPRLTTGETVALGIGLGAVGALLAPPARPEPRTPGVRGSRRGEVVAEAWETPLLPPAKQRDPTR